ncbi:MAG: hypothetical protein L6R43_05110, partial [Planctomycetes bacterium]|nr:hypothetical protein [Planctomycetota bacterium]
MRDAYEKHERRSGVPGGASLTDALAGSNVAHEEVARAESKLEEEAREASKAAAEAEQKLRDNFSNKDQAEEQIAKAKDRIAKSRAREDRKYAAKPNGEEARRADRASKNARHARDRATAAKGALATNRKSLTPKRIRAAKAAVKAAKEAAKAAKRAAREAKNAARYGTKEEAKRAAERAERLAAEAEAAAVQAEMLANPPKGTPAGETPTDEGPGRGSSVAVDHRSGVNPGGECGPCNIQCDPDQKCVCTWEKEVSSPQPAGGVEPKPEPETETEGTKGKGLPPPAPPRVPEATRKEEPPPPPKAEPGKPAADKAPADTVATETPGAGEGATPPAEPDPELEERAREALAAIEKAVDALHEKLGKLNRRGARLLDKLESGVPLNSKEERMLARLLGQSLLLSKTGAGLLSLINVTVAVLAAGKNGSRAERLQALRSLEAIAKAPARVLAQAEKGRQLIEDANSGLDYSRVDMEEAERLLRVARLPLPGGGDYAAGSREEGQAKAILEARARVEYLGFEDVRLEDIGSVELATAVNRRRLNDPMIAAWEAAESGTGAWGGIKRGVAAATKLLFEVPIEVPLNLLMAGANALIGSKESASVELEQAGESFVDVWRLISNTETGKVAGLGGRIAQGMLGAVPLEGDDLDSGLVRGARTFAKIIGGGAVIVGGLVVGGAAGALSKGGAGVVTRALGMAGRPIAAGLGAVGGAEKFARGVGLGNGLDLVNRFASAVEKASTHFSNPENSPVWQSLKKLNGSVPGLEQEVGARYLYRRISEEESLYSGVRPMGRELRQGNLAEGPLAHIHGDKPSEWISFTKDVEVAR